MRWATRVLRPNISAQISRRRLSENRPNEMFESSADVATDRKPASQVIEERACWNRRLHGVKRAAEADKGESVKRARPSVEGKCQAQDFVGQDCKIQ